ncbi:uncharacterized protein PAC_06467 [Phialocephala subalpina]|uniref:Uncharacterized protein n=1 Tax=Phialocephala subalpina TaxID=576137 RepID=A0A1L7WUY1_9HELO|nr:uncharacterized protein PAC_06467 [Phialocephala subalpina]
MASIPVALCVVHICQSVETAPVEIPALLRGEVVKPASGLESNTSRSPAEQRVPIAVIVGGAFSAADLEKIMSREGVMKLPWLKADPKLLPPGAGPPPDPAYPGFAAGAIERLFREHGFSVESTKTEEGALWHY